MEQTEGECVEQKEGIVKKIKYNHDAQARINEDLDEMIFVFGSNLAGRHGKGAALHAKKYRGAIYGQGIGLQGQSYAIPTKDFNIQTLPLEEILPYVEEFKNFAKNNPELKFYVTKIGCGLAGYTEADIAPMFKDCPDNCLLPEGWR